MPPRVDAQRREASLARLRQLRQAGDLSAGHILLAACGLGVDVRTIWRWLGRVR
jgi:putative transposase